MANWRQPSRIRRQGRMAAFPGATYWHRDMLNPYGPKGRYARTWNREGLARLWNEGFESGVSSPDDEEGEE